MNWWEWILRQSVRGRVWASEDKLDALLEQRLQPLIGPNAIRIIKLSIHPFSTVTDVLFKTADKESWDSRPIEAHVRAWFDVEVHRRRPIFILGFVVFLATLKYVVANPAWLNFAKSEGTGILMMKVVVGVVMGVVEAECAMLLGFLLGEYYQHKRAEQSVKEIWSDSTEGQVLLGPIRPDLDPEPKSTSAEIAEVRKAHNTLFEDFNTVRPNLAMKTAVTTELQTLKGDINETQSSALASLKTELTRLFTARLEDSAREIQALRNSLTDALTTINELKHAHLRDLTGIREDIARLSRLPNPHTSTAS